MPGNPRKRLEKIEQKMAEISRREGLSNCICKDRMVVARTKIFEARNEQDLSGSWVSSARKDNGLGARGRERERQRGISWTRRTGAGIRAPFRSSPPTDAKMKMTLKTSNSRCHALTKNGRPCRAAAMKDGKPVAIELECKGNFATVVALGA